MEGILSRMNFVVSNPSTCCRPCFSTYIRYLCSFWLFRWLSFSSIQTAFIFRASSFHCMLSSAMTWTNPSSTKVTRIFYQSHKIFERMSGKWATSVNRIFAIFFIIEKLFHSFRMDTIWALSNFAGFCLTSSNCLLYRYGACFGECSRCNVVFVIGYGP